MEKYQKISHMSSQSSAEFHVVKLQATDPLNSGDYSHVCIDLKTVRDFAAIIS